TVNRGGPHRLKLLAGKAREQFRGNCSQVSLCQRLETEHTVKSVFVKLSRARMLRAILSDLFHDAGDKVLESWNGFFVLDAHFPFGKRGAVCGFDLPGNTRIALLCRFLNVNSVEFEVIPVGSTPFVNAHCFFPRFVCCFLPLPLGRPPSLP